MSIDSRFWVPVRSFNGERAGVSFSQGVGYTDDAKAAHECVALGYKIVNLETGCEVQRVPTHPILNDPARIDPKAWRQRARAGASRRRHRSGT